MALAKQKRIKKKKEFERIFKTGVVVRNSFFLVKFLKNSLLFSRGAIVVPVSVSPGAVERNRIKRAIAESLKRIFQNSSLAPHERSIKADFIIVAQRGVKSKKFGEINRSLGDIFRKANIV